MAKFPVIKTKEQDSVAYAMLALAFGAISLSGWAWMLGLIGLVAGARGFMVARHLDNRRDLLFATAGIALGLFGFLQHFAK